jgi:hypothetical protein
MDGGLSPARRRCVTEFVVLQNSKESRVAAVLVDDLQLGGVRRLASISDKGS